MRPTWNEYFFDVASLVAMRSTCTRRRVGAVAIDVRKRIIATGYNGPPSGYPHCTPDTCYRTANNIPSGQDLDKCVAVHAEANVVCYAGSNLQGAVVFVTNQPCINCAKLLVSAGVAEIYWKDRYPDKFAEQFMLQMGGIYESEHFTLWRRYGFRGPIANDCKKLEQLVMDFKRDHELIEQLASQCGTSLHPEPSF